MATATIYLSGRKFTVNMATVNTLMLLQDYSLNV